MSNEHVKLTTPTPHSLTEVADTRQRPSAPADGPYQEDLDRVREIILGPDATRQRFRGAEADRLREILFGAQIESYEQRFADMQRELERLNSDLREAHERMIEVDKGAARRIEALELSLRKLTDEQRHEAERQRSRDALVQQLIIQVRQHEETIVGIGEGLLDLRKAHQSSETELRASKAEIRDARDQIEQRAQVARRDLRTTEDGLRAELRRVADRLDHQKTDRKALASMLIEIATRLETGNSVTGLLEGLSGAKE